MFSRYEHNPVVSPDPERSFESACAYNPCAVVHDDRVFLVYRAEGAEGVSSLCLASSEDGFSFEKYRGNPVIAPSLPEEKQGCEDPRITRIGGTFYLTYTAYDGEEVALGLATSEDMVRWEKRGIVLRGLKSGYILPEKVGGEWLMLVGEGRVRVARSPDLVSWRADREPFLEPRAGFFDSWLVEVGPQLLEYGDKLVMVYNAADWDRVYRPSFVVLDKADPSRVLYRHDEPLLEPSEGFELYGKVDNVVFAEGLVRFKDRYFLYYGGADRVVGVATVGVEEGRRLFFRG